MEQIFNANILGVKEIGMPFVNVGFIDKNGEKHTGAMLIDTGSIDCILNKDILELLSADNFIAGDTQDICMSSGRIQNFSAMSFSFYLQGFKFDEKFYVSEKSDLNFIFKPGELIGIIGNQFLKKYGLVLDFENLTLCLSNSDITFSERNCEFLFPLSYGMKKYKLPIIPINGKGTPYFLVADSGCNVTSITNHAVVESGMKVELTGDTNTLVDLSSRNSIVTRANAKLAVLSCTDQKNVMREVIMDDHIHVVSGRNYFVEVEYDTDEKKGKHPISGLLSTTFMERNRWILDFNKGMIYSIRRVA